MTIEGDFGLESVAGTQEDAPVDAGLGADETVEGASEPVVPPRRPVYQILMLLDARCHCCGAVHEGNTPCAR